MNQKNITMLINMPIMVTQEHHDSVTNKMSTNKTGTTSTIYTAENDKNENKNHPCFNVLLGCKNIFQEKGEKIKLVHELVHTDK